MNLSDYISLTLNEITEGVEKSKETYEVCGGCRILNETPKDIVGMPYVVDTTNGQTVRKPIVNVAFRVGVELEETKEKGGSLRVVALDASASKKDGSKSIHEITFSLPLILPKD